MTVFVLRRLIWTLPVLLVAVSILFLLMRSIGGNPFRHGPLLGLRSQGGWVKYGDFQPTSIRNALARRYGLDLPWYRQYANYLEGVVTFNLGPSFSFRNRSVNDIIREHGPVSGELLLLAFAWAVALGVPAGVLAALRSGSTLDYAVRLLANVGYALPSFLVATLLVYVLALKLGWLPTSGWESWKHKLLPSLTLGVVPMAYCARLLRGGMMETLELDYVRAAKAKGLPGALVVRRHVLRTSIIPVVAVLGPLLGFMMTALFVVETIFAVPGLGRYFVAAASARDYPLVMGITVVLTIAVFALNLVLDVLHRVLDPRLAE